MQDAPAGTGIDLFGRDVQTILSDSKPPLARTTQPFSFAVVGDLHFGLSSTQTELELGTAPRDPSRVERFVDNVAYALEPSCLPGGTGTWQTCLTRRSFRSFRGPSGVMFHADTTQPRSGAVI